MRKTLLTITTLSLLLLNNNIFADTTTYKNLDKIEKVWYFHSALLTWGTWWGWAWDWRFNNSWQAWFSKYNELKDLFANIESNISIFTTSVWILNNTPQIQEKNQFWTIYSEPDWTSYTSPENINKTWTDEYMLIPSKDLLSNLAKNPIFKDKTNKNDILSYLQSDFFKWKQVKIIWRYFKIKWTYKYSNPFLWDKSLDMDLNIIIVDDISLDTNSNTTKQVIKQIVKQDIQKPEVKNNAPYVLVEADNKIITSNTKMLDDYFSKITDSNISENEVNRITSAIKTRQSKYESNSRSYLIFQSYLDYINKTYGNNLSLDEIMGQKIDLWK